MLLSDHAAALKYRAPAENGGCMSVPPWDALPALARVAAPTSPTDEVAILGQSLVDFQQSARREVLAAAEHYVGQYAEIGPAADPTSPLVVTGHQPSLIHPGVWLKNFASARLADELGGTALQLIIDTDVAGTPAVRVPTGSPEEPVLRSIAYDGPHAPVAWEERRVVDPAAWEAFGERVTSALAPMGFKPLASSWWSDVLAQSGAGVSPGLAIAQARHRFEMARDIATLELPHSRVCQTAAFRRFLGHVLAHLPRLRECYNDALAGFRRRHHIRNAAQPMPDLAEADRWLEAPLWLWSSGDPARRPLWARYVDGGVEIADRRSFQATLPLTPELDPQPALDQIDQWERQGVRIRSRALLTTMFARLALGDLFIHGIGGARYDEATDAIAGHFFHVELAPYAAISGTLRLPIPHPRADADDVRNLRQRLRELRFHPERFLESARLTDDGKRQANSAVAEKRHWISTVKTPSNARRRHQGIEAANHTLGALLAAMRRDWERQLSATRQAARKSAVLDSREYAFCLFPQHDLEQFLLDFPAQLA